MDARARLVPVVRSRQVHLEQLEVFGQQDGVEQRVVRLAVQLDLLVQLACFLGQRPELLDHLAEVRGVGSVSRVDPEHECDDLLQLVGVLLGQAREVASG